MDTVEHKVLTPTESKITCFSYLAVELHGYATTLQSQRNCSKLYAFIWDIRFVTNYNLSFLVYTIFKCFFITYYVFAQFIVRMCFVFRICNPFQITYCIVNLYAIYMINTRLIFRIWNKSLCNYPVNPFKGSNAIDGKSNLTIPVFRNMLFKSNGFLVRSISLTGLDRFNFTQFANLIKVFKTQYWQPLYVCHNCIFNANVSIK